MHSSFAHQQIGSGDGDPHQTVKRSEARQHRPILSWVTTIPFLLLCATTLVIWHPIIALTKSISVSLHRWVIAVGNRVLLLHLAVVGRSVRVDGLERLPSSGPLIVVSNHQSLFDIALFIWHFRRYFPRFIAKQELARGFPSASYVLRTGGSALIDRKDPAQAVPEIRRCGTLAQDEGGAVVLFPEGTRARTGNLRPFKTGGIRALIETMPGAPIAVVAIDGSHDIFARNLLPVPYGGEVHLRVIDIISPSEAQMGHDSVIERARKGIETALGNVRQTA